jgi:hypothetical protein
VGRASGPLDSGTPSGTDPSRGLRDQAGARLFSRRPTAEGRHPIGQRGHEVRAGQMADLIVNLGMIPTGLTIKGLSSCA